MMKIRKFGAAMVLSGMIAGAMMFSTATVEAKKSKPDAHDAICGYLASVINYAYASDAIKSSAMSLFIAYDCDPALLQ
jgi:uncharacterized protein YdbL (DUF1318 family)